MIICIVVVVVVIVIVERSLIDSKIYSVTAALLTGSMFLAKSSAFE